MILIRFDLCKDNIGLGLFNILFESNQLWKQWPTPDTMLMKIDK